MISEARVKKYCKDYTRIENYEKAIVDSEVWDCHHRLESHTSDGEERLVQLSRAELKALGMYYDRPPEELIFLTHEEHAKLLSHSEEYKREMSEKLKGRHHSEEHKKKISEACKHPKKKIYYRFFLDDNGEFQIDLDTGYTAPPGYKLLTVEVIENSKKVRYI